MNDGGIRWWQEVGQYRAVTEWPLLQQEPKMKIDQMIPSKYLKTGDIERDTVVSIKEVKKTNVAAQGEIPEYKFVVYFHELEKGMVLNATNIKRLGKYLSNDSDDWIGQQVVLYVDDNVQYGSDIVSGLRIKGLPRNTLPKKSSDDDVNRKLRDAEPDVPF